MPGCHAMGAMASAYEVMVDPHEALARRVLERGFGKHFRCSIYPPGKVKPAGISGRRKRAKKTPDRKIRRGGTLLALSRVSYSWGSV